MPRNQESLITRPGMRLFLQGVLLLFSSMFLLISAIEVEEKVALFPLQMRCNITITAHQVDDDGEFPPRIRRIGVYYDYIQQRARADIAAGYEAEKVYIRRYDMKMEYMVRVPPIDDCKRSYLEEIMPYPLIPEHSYQKDVLLNGKECHYYMFEDFETRIHMYFYKDSSIPVQLIQENFSNTEQQESQPMLTYDFTDVVIGAPDEKYFELKSAVPDGDRGGKHSYKSCQHHVGGFPYLHIFHYFVKF